MAGLWTTVIEDINSIEVNTVSSIFKLCLSLILGCCVGFERKRKGQIAGVRTFALISMGATLAMLLSIYVPQEYMGLKNGDPGRIAAQVVTGIGFLGAGAIIQMKGSVRGLTTAAGIWMIAAIGMAVGVGLYLLSIIATGLILLILVVIERWEHRINVGVESRIIRIKLSVIAEDIEGYREVLMRHGVHLTNVYVEYDYTGPVTRLNLVVLIRESTNYLKLFSELRQVKPTDAISMANQVSI
ncbi:MAG TPA: MgtC/SapB family protein [Muribaculum sp.]|jgi:putative Mg2+ transporter-C (MgtC) family protein|uniref:MgtC/SapB family protein n=1 Tax=Heminiphilus faecis TaxID=2601703 RepID=A0ABV4CUA3_9BACT|nr:MgtC/SapB family protein [Heminiphilus faecis]RLT75829.1 MgtC/SapB family protein [bacterium J10(2018)]HRF69419.1 MgtC/SapB family protein [Muribaculum sp.]